MTKKYELGIIWLIYAIITFLAGHFTYTITPNYFIYKPGLGKTRKFPLANLYAYEQYLGGNLQNFELSDQEIAQSLDKLEKIM